MPKIKKEFDQTKYQNEYKKKTYDRMELLVPKGEKAVIKEKAAAVGTSVNEFVYSAVKEKNGSNGSSNRNRRVTRKKAREHNMGLFSNLFSKKNTAAVQPQPVQMPEEKKPRYIIKNQRFILDNVKDHMEDIMDLVDENEDYKMKDRDFIDEKQENEKVFQYEINEKATITTISCEGGAEQLQVFVRNTHIGDIKKGGISRVKNLLKKGNIENIWVEVSGGKYKMIKEWDDEYTVLDTETPFSITIEITYKEEITE